MNEAQKSTPKFFKTLAKIKKNNYTKTMKEKTKGNLFRSVLSIALAIVLFLGVALVFAGCDEDDEFYDPENPSASPSFFERYVGGFNTVFANDSSGYGGIDEGEEGQDSAREWATFNFRADFIDALTYFYVYYPKGLPDSLTELNNKFSTPHYDSNRVLVYQSEEELVFKPDIHWNWLINPFFSPTLSALYQLVFSPNLDYSTWLEEFVNYIEGEDGIDISLYNFNLFNNILQIVLYEIMLGYTNLTTVSVEIKYDDESLASGTYEIKIDFCNDSSLNNFTVYSYTNKGTTTTTNNTGSLREYNEALQTQYENQTRYTGFTKDNADRFITYILDEVIGTEIVRYDHDNFKDGKTNYRNYVEVVANIVYELTYDGSGDAWTYTYEGLPAPNNTVNFETTDESGNLKGQTDFAAKPATYVRYFPGETLFGEDDVDYQFSNKPIGEYQSILVVPARTITTLLEGGIRLEAGFVFNFMSYNKDLKINAKVRYQYYNEITGYRKLFEFDCDQINFDDGYEGVDPDGRTYWENDFELSIETDALPADVVTTEKDATGYEVTYYTIGFFNNDSLLDAVAGAEGGEVTLTEFEAIQDLYKVIASQNGYGGITVLNEKKINSSFFEIVLDVVKTPNDPPDTDYNFRLVLSNTLLTPGIY